MQATGIVGSILPMIIGAVLSLIGLEIIPVAKGKIKNGKRIALIYVAATSLFFLSIIVSLIGGKIAGGGIANRPGSSDTVIGDSYDKYGTYPTYYEKEGKRAANAIKLYEGETVYGSFDYVKEPGDKVWFEFKPEYTGTYVFTETSSQPSTISVKKPRTKTIYESDTGTVFAELEEGKRYFIVVEMVDGANWEFRVSANRLGANEMWKNNYQSLTFYGNTLEKWYRFVPEESGYYEFFEHYATNNGYEIMPNAFQLYYDGQIIADSNITTGIQAELTAGNVYYVRLMRTNFSNSYTEYKMELTVEMNHLLSAPVANVGDNDVKPNSDGSDAFTQRCKAYRAVRTS